MRKFSPIRTGHAGPPPSRELRDGIRRSALADAAVSWWRQGAGAPRTERRRALRRMTRAAVGGTRRPHHTRVEEVHSQILSTRRIARSQCGRESSGKGADASNIGSSRPR